MTGWYADSWRPAAGFRVEFRPFSWVRLFRGPAWGVCICPHFLKPVVRMKIGNLHVRVRGKRNLTEIEWRVILSQCEMKELNLHGLAQS
jgi:hypothetical protein